MTEMTTSQVQDAVARLLGRKLDVQFSTRPKRYALDGLEGKGWGFSDRHAWLSEEGILVLEVERGQPHVEGNVAKYWPWLEENPAMRLGLIHAYARVPGKQTKALGTSRERVASWLAKRIEASEEGERFSYRRCVVHLGSRKTIEGEAGLHRLVRWLRRGG